MILLTYLLTYLLKVVLSVWQVLIYTAGHINYGGRVTDDWDRRCMMNVLDDYYNDKVLSIGHLYDASGVYHQIDPATDLEVTIAACYYGSIETLL